MGEQGGQFKFYDSRGFNRGGRAWVSGTAMAVLWSANGGLSRESMSLPVKLPSVKAQRIPYFFSVSSESY